MGQTIVQDYIAHQGGVLLNVIPVPGKMTRVSGFTFRQGNRALPGASNGTVILGDNSRDPLNGHFVRLDHCHFDGLLNAAIGAKNLIGLIDHVYCTATALKNEYFLYCQQPNWGGLGYGDGSWIGPIDHNGTNWIICEDLYLSRPGFAYTWIDGQQGTRFI